MHSIQKMLKKINLDELKNEVDIIYRRRLIFVIILFFILLLIGTYIYHHLEKWSYFDSLYFTITTLTTVGYGDLTPQTFYGRLFTMFYMVFGISIALYSLSFLASHYIEKREVYWMERISKGKDIVLRLPQEIIRIFKTKKFK